MKVTSLAVVEGGLPELFLSCNTLPVSAAFLRLL